MDYEKNPRHNILLYRNLIDHRGATDVRNVDYLQIILNLTYIIFIIIINLHYFFQQFTWRPYLGLDHVPNDEDAEVWTAKTAIIRFNIVEMHHSDRVKMQFGMFQDIPRDPICLDPWHLKRVNAQWGLNNWRNFAREYCRMWKNRADHILQFPVSEDDEIMQHSRQYIAWYQTVTVPDMHVSQPRYLVDPRTQWGQPQESQQQRRQRYRQQQPQQQSPQQPQHYQQQQEQPQHDQHPPHQHYQQPPQHHYQQPPQQSYQQPPQQHYQQPFQQH